MKFGLDLTFKNQINPNHHQNFIYMPLILHSKLENLTSQFYYTMKAKIQKYTCDVAVS